MNSRLGQYGLLMAISILITTHSTPAIAAFGPQPVALAQQVTSADDLGSQAQQAYQLGRYEQARTAWEAAYREAERRGDRPSQITILNALTNTYRQLGDWEQAEIAIQRSLQLLADIDKNKLQGVLLQAQTINTQGATLLANGQAKQAHTLWVQAEQLYRQANDQEGTLGSRINQVQALQALGLYRQAYLQLIDIQTDIAALPSSALKVAGFKSLGDVFQITGNLQEAKDVLQESIQLAEEVGDRASISVAWLSLGNAYQGTEQYDAAVQAYAMAAQTAVSPLSEATAALSEVSLLVKTQQWDLAQHRLSRLKPLTATLSPSRMGIYAQVNLASNLLAVAQNSDFSASSSAGEIAQYLSTAIRHAQVLNDQRAEAYALGQLGAVYEHTQQYDYALDLTNQALDLSLQLNSQDIAYRWQWQKGRILKAKAKTANGQEVHQHQQAAISAYQASVDTLKLIRSDLMAADSAVRFSFRDAVEPIYREFVDLLISEDASEASLQMARQAIEDLQLAELQNFFRSACLDIQAQQIDQIDSTAAVIYPVILPERLLVITSVPGKPLQHHSLSITEAELNQTVEEYLQSLNPVFDRSVRLQVSETLYQWLVAPLKATLKEQQIDTLVFVLDGALRNIPIAALHSGKDYLIEEFNVALTPGMQLLPPRESVARRPNILAGAITEAHQGFPALPGVARELESISSTFPTSVFINERFTASTLQKEVNQNDFPILHLATHGQFSSSLDQTFLIGWDEPLRIQDFQVLVREQLPEIQKPIELLVLSACETAEGDDRAALGLAGFAVRSGARSTLATLWAVNDQSTSALISEFYHQLAQDGTSKAEALRQAQMVLLNDPQYAHPFYWAPFVLVGNWL
ncbi:hypothetical protein C7271_19735 [filamentous cyanobacterium CCP5]|nr:hypothetical protein C7271_19735 [filamentous cyanobacterium CCP5]